MKTLKELILEFGEEWRPQFSIDFGLECADRVCDFYNNDGLETFNEEYGEHLSVIFVAVIEGDLVIGAWRWLEGEDFDRDATWLLMEEDWLIDSEKEQIINKIKDIYGKQS